MLPYAVIILPCGVARLYFLSELDGIYAILLIALVGLIALLRKWIAGCKVVLAKMILTHMLLELVQGLLLLTCILGSSPHYLYFSTISTVICLMAQISPTNSRHLNTLLIIKHFILWFVYFGSDMFLPLCIVLFTVALMLIRVDHYSILAQERCIRTQALEEEERRLRNLLQVIPDGVLVVTSDCKLSCWNESLLSMLGVQEKDLEKALGRLELEDGAPLLEVIHRYISEPFPHSSLGTVIVGGLSLEWRASQCTWSHTLACILIARDNSGWRDVQAKLKKESTFKTSLIRSVSHELRTPTNAIINLVRGLIETVPLEFKPDLEVVGVCSHFLLSMINDLLDFSKVLVGKFTLVKVQFDLVAELEFVMRLFRPQASVKGIDLRLNVDPFLPKVVYTDCTRLQQILLNLLSNAFKFTAKGTIRLTVSHPTRCQVRFSVSDTGIGIPAAMHVSIFQPYGKLLGNDELNPQGSGLGLGISNMLAKELGGQEISLVSAERKGATFSFVVDIEQSKLICEEGETLGEEETEVAEETEAALPLHFLAGRSVFEYRQVLIVDDNEFNRLVLRKLLKSLGVEAEEACTGKEAVDKVKRGLRKNHCYRLILMDLEMPEMNGLQATNVILPLLQEPCLEGKTEIIACSAYCSDEDKQLCLLAGMVAYLEKPISREAVADFLRRAQLIE